jgi:uncharacterized protein
MLLHGLPGIEKHLDIAYALRDLGWNCLCFHFKGCWGSHGAYDLSGLADDTRAATDWVAQQGEVDPKRIVLIGASTGSHPAFVCGAADPRIRAVVGISPVIEPRAFSFRPKWPPSLPPCCTASPVRISSTNGMRSRRSRPRCSAFSPRPVLLVASEQDDIFPPLQYAAVVAPFANLQLVTHPDADHSFSAYRPWLVHTVTDWLLNRLAR